MQRSPAPVDKEIYLYSQFETADAQKAFACFDQPDLKSVFTWHVTVPAHWRVRSSAPQDRREPAAGAGGKTVHLVPAARVGTDGVAVGGAPLRRGRPGRRRREHRGD